MYLKKGQTKQLRVIISPGNASNRKITWRSTKKNIVSVTKKGKIKAKKPGKAYVVAMSNDGSRKTARILINVGIKVRKITMPTNSMTLDVSQTASVKGEVHPENATKKKLKYTSSAPEIVSVSSNGTVTGKAKGEATVTATSTDGSNKKVKCKVSVKIPTQSIRTNVSYTGTQIRVGEVFAIQANVVPANASNTNVVYSCSNSNIAKVAKDGAVTGVSPGRVKIKVSAADGRSSTEVEIEVYKVEIKNQKLIAHRGFSSEVPENTTEAFKLALTKEYYGVECDIRKTFDGKYIVSHDETLERMCGKNLTISKLDREQILKYKLITGSNIEKYPDLTLATFEEYLDIMATSDTIHPFIELKEDYSTADLQNIVNMVKERKLLDRTYFISMYQTALVRLKKISGVNIKQLQYVYGAEDDNKYEMVNDEIVQWCVDNQIDLDARYNLLTASHVDMLRGSGRQVNVWTVNVLETAFSLVHDMHVDMITTEYYLNSED